MKVLFCHLLKKCILIYISFDISTGKHGNTFLHELSLEMYLHKTYRNPVYGSEHTNNAYLISNLPFNLAVAGSSVQSISASDLLKQQKEQHQQRMLARKKRAEEIQKR